MRAMSTSKSLAYCVSFLAASFAEGDDLSVSLGTVPTPKSTWMVTPSSHSDEVGVDVSASALELVAVLEERSEESLANA